jgi:hypothetical protein
MIPVENGRGQGFLFRMSPNQIIGPRILSFGALISSFATLLRYLRLLRYRTNLDRIFHILRNGPRPDSVLKDGCDIVLIRGG